jgi:hypothetical protein
MQGKEPPPTTPNHDIVCLEICFRLIIRSAIDQHSILTDLPGVSVYRIIFGLPNYLRKGLNCKVIKRFFLTLPLVKLLLSGNIDTTPGHLPDHGSGAVS